MSNPELIVIGGGIAGQSAALFAARAGVAPVVLEGRRPGGRLVTAPTLSNYPGLPASVTPGELIDRAREQARLAGARSRWETASKLASGDSGFRLELENGESLDASAVILSLGTVPRRLGWEGDERLLGRGLSYCATCDGAFFRGQRVAVVGGGDVAFEEALYLAGIAERVTILYRGSQPSACAALVRSAGATANLELVGDTEVLGCLGVERLTGLRVRRDGVESEWAADGAFVALGGRPETAWLPPTIARDAAGYVAIRPGSAATSLDGVFAAGACVDRRFAHAITAAGDGARAALEVVRWLAERA